MDTPADYKNAGICNLVAGIVNVGLAGIWVLSLIWVCVGLLWLVPMAIGAWQAWVGYQMMQEQRDPNARNAALVGMVVSVVNCNLIALACSVVGWVMLDKPEVKAWLEG